MDELHAQPREPSIIDAVLDTPLRHLASQSSLNTNSSHRSTSSRGVHSIDSDFRSRRSNRGRTFRPLSTTFEHQRYGGNSQAKLSRTTKIFLPETGSDTSDSLSQPSKARIRLSSDLRGTNPNDKEKEEIQKGGANRSDLSSQKNDVDTDPLPSIVDEEKALEQQEEDETVYPGPIGLTLLSIGLMLCVFLIALDRTIITPAVPYIVNEFQSYPDTGWYGSAYLMTAGAFQPLYGRVFMLFDIKWSYLICLGIFELGSLICGTAPNSKALIVGRAIQGLGSAGILTGSFVVCSHAVPLKKRPILTAVVGIMFGVGSTLGPIIGGAFTEYATWRWNFYLNLPVGAATAVVLFIFFTPNTKHAMMEKSFFYRVFELDLVGNVLILGATVQLFLALQYTETHVAWSSPLVVGLLTGAGATLAVFCAWMWWKAEGALIPPRIIGQRSVAASCAMAFFLYAATLLHMFYLPFWFQAIQGASATTSGVNLIPYVVATVIFTLIGGIFVAKSGYFTIPAIAGCCIGTVGCGLVTMLEVDTNKQWIGYEICASAGIGLAVQQGFSAIQIVLPLDDVAIGTACVVAFQSLGGAIFISVGNNLLQNHLLKAGRENLLPGVDVQRVIDAGAASFRNVVTPEQLPALLAVYNDALRQAFVAAIPLCGLAAVSACFLEWRNVKDQSRKLEESARRAADRRNELEKSILAIHDNRATSAKS